MPKIRLNLDELAVDSFPVSTIHGTFGTVRAAGNTGFTDCFECGTRESCRGTCGLLCTVGVGCGSHTINDPATCTQAVTCIGDTCDSCGGTCDGSCYTCVGLDTCQAVGGEACAV